MGLPDKVEKLLEGKDWELRFHTISQWVACEAISKSSLYWEKLLGNHNNKFVNQLVNILNFEKDTFDNEATKLTILNQLGEKLQPKQPEINNNNNNNNDDDNGKNKQGAAS